MSQGLGAANELGLHERFHQSVHDSQRACETTLLPSYFMHIGRRLFSQSKAISNAKQGNKDWDNSIHKVGNARGSNLWVPCWPIHKTGDSCVGSKQEGVIERLQGGLKATALGNQPLVNPKPALAVVMGAQNAPPVDGYKAFEETSRFVLWPMWNMPWMLELCLSVLTTKPLLIQP